MSVTDRANRFRLFETGSYKILVTTNLVARCIDIPEVNLIVNFDLPKSATDKVDMKTFLYRIGRGGRYGRVCFVLNLTASNSDLINISKRYGIHINKIAI